MLMNIPIAVILVSGLRILFNEVEFRWKVPTTRLTPYLSYLEKKQLSVNNSRLTTRPSPQKWKRKIDSPIVEEAIEDFINKILHDFVIDLWYSDITPDKEAPQLIHGIVMDALGEVSERIKEVNIVDLFTRDVINLIGDHINLFRRNQDAIGVDVMRILSSEERDERLKHHLLISKELHPALISPECEYKVLQRLMDGVLAIVLRPREAQCPLVRCIAREILTCLVVQPIMDFASPGYINEILEYIIIAYKDWGFKDFSTDQSPNMESHETQNKDHSEARQNGQSNKSNLRTNTSFNNPGTDLSLSSEHKRVQESDAPGNPFSSTVENELMHSRPADWAKVFDAATQRRTEVLMPENLENMWAIGRNYKKDLPRTSSIADSIQRSKTWSETDDKTSMRPPRPQEYTQPTDFSIDILTKLQNLNKDANLKEGSPTFELESDGTMSLDCRNKLKRSNSTSDVKTHLNLEDILLSKSTVAIIDEYYSSEGKHFREHNVKSSLDMVLCTEVLHPPKLRCRVLGAYFEKLGSNSFAVYSIAVTDAENNTWFVKRRYRNFERLHRNLKDIPNYTLHLPPKRIFSSSTEDAFVHQRCIQLDKYLQDLLSIANVAEQHEVWDFVSVSSKNYLFGKATSLMKTLTVNVDDTVDDIARQSTGVSGGLEPIVSFASQNLSCSDDKSKITMRQSALKYSNSFPDNDEGDKGSNHGQKEVMSLPKANGWHSDSDLDSKGFPPMVIKCGEYVNDLDTEEMDSRLKSESRCTYPESTLGLTPVPEEDPAGVPPEWTPPNLSVPMLNLVDNIFQLKGRGWLRRQVFWMSKQILQLVMEDAIDDFLLRQIQWIRREEVIAQGIRWVQDVLWPDGTFYLRLRILEQLKKNTGEPSGNRITQPGSFEQQLEAARRANDVRKFIFNGAPTALVSFIGKKQYKRCVSDLYYFLQSTICLKQLGYGILELVLIAVFPELGDLVKDIHTKIDGLS